MTHPTDTAKSEELKACPWGHEGIVKLEEPNHGRKGYCVCCFVCGSSPGAFDTPAEAIAAWNRRSSPPQNDAGVERLREAIEAVKNCRDIAMRCCVTARAPECGEFAAIAQDLDAALPALTPLSEPQALGQEFEAGWQPIETAPKDGKNVLLLIGETIPDLPDVRVGCYLTMQDARDVGYPDAGWLVWNDCHDYFVTDRATHWLPLPSAPSGEG